MNKLKIVLLLLCLTGKIIAQTAPPPQPVVVVPVATPPPPSSSTGNIAPSWEGFRLGLQIEPLLSWGKAKDNSISTSGVKPNFGFGIMGDFFFSRNYALNTGLSFVYLAAPITYDSSKAFKIPNSILFPKNTTLDYRLQYIEIPIDFKLKTDQVGYMSYYGQFGGVLGVNIGSKGDFSAPGNANSSYDMTNVTLSNNVNLINLGLLIGAGIEYNVVGHTNLMAGVSYVNNFTNFTGNPANAAINHFDLNLGVFF